MHRILLLLVLVALSACAPRGRLAYLNHPDPAAREIYVGTTRAPDLETGNPFGWGRSLDLRLARFAVATPPDHTIGKIDYPKAGERADPGTQFMISSAQIDMKQSLFRADLHAALQRNGGQAVVFVHGFNNDFSEGLYRMAQLGTDFNIPGVLVHYSWPSRANVLGYAYDRDSVLFARDGLVRLLDELKASGATHIMLIGHSLGAELTMEALRQEALARDQSLLSRLNGVILVSPDIAVDVFKTQVRTIGKLPQPFVIFTSQKDRALRLSARLTGQSDRLGNLENVDRLAQYRITVINTAAFNTGDGHFNVADSPALIRILDRAGNIAKVLEGDQKGRTSLASGVVLTVENATQIVLRAQSGG
ncbi:hypothetical protein DL1_17395 [Thioclava dalianensis]|uniref:Esterase n=1 Tax=Thioclava dalianensis TaxID=1185766 RepID=A0A074TMY1_9RHOB|nr:alpha/beta fold hydrolase [Thioclava dalianensis]KEP70333.1 hypothetical protein DL1_17395 [Thioclava dalianensis]SFN33219.1 Esterase/lipase superfamily enzyme [Thioclava dalianensis]